jgi:hypothetical protein
MITTTASSTTAALVIHRVTGAVGEREAAAGASEALEFAQRAAALRGRLALLLDLRGVAFASLAAHRAWSVGFARNPALGAFVRRVAIVGDDTPSFRAEQTLLASDHVRFFVDRAGAELWLAAV